MRGHACTIMHHIVAGMENSNSGLWASLNALEFIRKGLSIYGDISCSCLSSYIVNYCYTMLYMLPLLALQISTSSIDNWRTSKLFEAASVKYIVEKRWLQFLDFLVRHCELGTGPCLNAFVNESFPWWSMMVSGIQVSRWKPS